MSKLKHFYKRINFSAFPSRKHQPWSFPSLVLLLHHCQNSPKASKAEEDGDLQLLCWQQLLGTVPICWCRIHWDRLGYPEQTPKHSPRALLARHTWTDGCCHCRQSWRALRMQLPLHRAVSCQAFSHLNKLPQSAPKPFSLLEGIGEMWRYRLLCAELTRELLLRDVARQQKVRGRWRHVKDNDVLQWHVVLECKLGAGRAQRQFSTCWQQGLFVHREPEATAQPAGPAARAMLKGSLKIKCLSGREEPSISSLCLDWWLAQHGLGGFLVC